MRFASFLSTALVVASAVEASPSRRRPVVDSDKVVAYWGNTGYLPDGNIPISTICSNPDVDIVVLSFLTTFPDQTSNGLPVLNFGNACGDTYPNGLLKCSAIADGISQCQAAGKEVLLSLGGAYPHNQAFASSATAINFADWLWDNFGSETTLSSTRPFLTSVINGIDLDIESTAADSQSYFPDFISELRTKSRNTWKISAAPQCVIPDAHFSNYIQTSWFDYIFVQLYNTDGCSAHDLVSSPSASTNTFGNWLDGTLSSTTGYANSDTKVFAGLPASTIASNGDSTGSRFYLTPNEVKQLVHQFYTKTSFGGISLWDASYDYHNQICGQPYSYWVKKALKDIIAGDFTAFPSTCQVTSSSSSSSSSSIASSTSSSIHSSTSSAVSTTSSAVSSSSSVAPSSSSSTASVVSSSSSLSSSPSSSGITSSSRSSAAPVITPSSSLVSSSAPGSSSSAVSVVVSSSRSSSSSFSSAGPFANSTTGGLGGPRPTSSGSGSGPVQSSHGGYGGGIATSSHGGYGGALPSSSASGYGSSSHVSSSSGGYGGSYGYGGHGEPSSSSAYDDGYGGHGKPTATKTSTTTYVDTCSTGLTTKTYTWTKTCSEGEDDSTTTSGAPEGWTVTTVRTAYSGKPTTFTLTKPYSTPASAPAQSTGGVWPHGGPNGGPNGSAKPATSTLVVVVTPVPASEYWAYISKHQPTSSTSAVAAPVKSGSGSDSWQLSYVAPPKAGSSSTDVKAVAGSPTNAASWALGTGLPGTKTGASYGAQFTGAAGRVNVGAGVLAGLAVAALAL